MRTASRSHRQPCVTEKVQCGVRAARDLPRLTMPASPRSSTTRRHQHPRSQTGFERANHRHPSTLQANCTPCVGCDPILHPHSSHLHPLRPSYTPPSHGPAAPVVQTIEPKADTIEPHHNNHRTAPRHVILRGQQRRAPSKGEIGETAANIYTPTVTPWPAQTHRAPQRNSNAAPVH